MGTCISVSDEKKGEPDEQKRDIIASPAPLVIETKDEDNDASRGPSSPGDGDRVSPIGGDRFTQLLKRSMKRVHTINDMYSIRSKTSNVFSRATFSDSGVSPYDVVSEMLKGNHRFINGATLHPHQDFKRISAVAPKQHPLAAVLSCADSRVPVEIVFDVGFGDIFVCRVAGNLATPEELASLEYAVLECGVKVVMVMGHTSCGAIKAALSGKAFPGYIDSLIGNLDVPIMRHHTRTSSTREQMIQAQSSILKHGAKHERSNVGAAEIDAVIRENIRYQLERIERSPIIYEALESGELILVPCIYCIQTGKVEVLTAYEDVDVKDVTVKLTEK